VLALLLSGCRDSVEACCIDAWQRATPTVHEDRPSLALFTLRPLLLPSSLSFLR